MKLQEVGCIHLLRWFGSYTLNKEAACSSNKLVSTKVHSVTTHINDLEGQRLHRLPTHSAIFSWVERLSTVTATVCWMTRRQTGRQELCNEILNNKLTVAQLHKKFPAFYTTRRLEQSQHSYPRQDVSNSLSLSLSHTHTHVIHP